MAAGFDGSPAAGLLGGGAGSPLPGPFLFLVVRRKRQRPSNNMDNFYQSKAWERLKLSILRRDGYMCQESKRYGKAVQANTVHHIFPRDEYPEYQWEPWNLISLSSKAHDEMHDRNTGRLTEKGKRLLDRTARGALMLDGISEKRRWVDCITDAMRWLAEEQPDLQRLLFGHYWMDCAKGYKRSHARSFYMSYCKVYHISHAEYHRRRLDALNELAFYAMEYGLLQSHTERRKTVLIS